MTFTREQSRTKVRFWRFFDKLPPHIQQTARKKYQIFLVNPRSVRFKPLQNKKREYYSADVNGNYRAIGEIIGDTIYWEFIGNHSAYEDYIATLE